MNLGGRLEAAAKVRSPRSHREIRATQKRFICYVLAYVLNHRVVARHAL